MNRIFFAGLSALLVAACAGEPDCDPLSAFDAGRSEQAAEVACDQPAYGQAWRLGQTLGELERELAELQAREPSLTTSERARLRILTRDILELETLARIQGLLSPADITPPGD